MRDTGSVWKKSRRLDYSILETGEELRKRPYGPGQHGNNRRRKVSEYGKQLMEKQKLRHTYGVNEVIRLLPEVKISVSGVGGGITSARS
jgi:small subunit ribosomal protein S4